MKHLLAALVLLSFSPANAQDVNAQLADIAGKDPVKAAVAAEAALSSPSATTRSLALEATLKSTDGRVRAIGYTHLVKNQKQLIIEVEIPASFANDSDPLKRTLRDSPTFVTEVQRFKPENNTFDGFMKNAGPMSGTVARDGITINKVLNHGIDCVFRLNGIANEYLTGTLTCRTLVLKIKSALP